MSAWRDRVGGLRLGGSILVVAALAMAAVVLLSPDDPPVRSVGATVAERLASEPSTASPSSPQVPLAPAPTSPAAATTSPAWLRFPDLGVDAPVVAVGVNQAGAMEIPDDVDSVGWYRFGARPGDSQGSAVLAGHINDRDQGVGVFAALEAAELGQQFTVGMADGAILTYAVVSRERIPKAALPLDRLFDRAGPPRIVLVTCGGAFAGGNYSDNIVVTAVPVP